MRENFEKSDIKYRVMNLGSTRDVVVNQLNEEFGAQGEDWDFYWYVGGVLYEKQEMLQMYEDACLTRIQENPDRYKQLLEEASCIIETWDDLEVGVNWEKLNEPGRANNNTVVAWRRALQRYFRGDEQLEEYDESLYNRAGRVVCLRDDPSWHEFLDAAHIPCPVTDQLADLKDVPLKNKPAVERWYPSQGPLSMEMAWQQRVVAVFE